MEIPRVIHYCWFGGKPLPELAERCIASWKRYMPDYEIRRWDEQTFDVRRVAYTDEAYRLRQYAHVSDYARFWILYHHGGIYFDTDVEVVAPMDDIIKNGAFAGFEGQLDRMEEFPYGIVNPGLGMGAPAKHPFFAQMLERYDHMHFAQWNGKSSGNVPHLTTRELDLRHSRQLEDGLTSANGLTIYPEDYFCPINYFTHEERRTERTRTVHHYMASWVKRQNRLQSAAQRMRFALARLRSTMTCRTTNKKIDR